MRYLLLIALYTVVSLDEPVQNLCGEINLRNLNSKTSYTKFHKLIQINKHVFLFI